MFAASDVLVLSRSELTYRRLFSSGGRLILEFRSIVSRYKKFVRGGFSRNYSGSRDGVRDARVRIERGFKN